MMENRMVKCNSASDWSFCVGICSNDYKGDDWCTCYSSDSVTLALALDGVSGSTVEEVGEECLAKGATAARAVANYYMDTVVPILEESVNSDQRLGLLLMAESVSPGRVSVSLRSSLLRWIIRSVRSKLLGLLGGGQRCLVGGQVVFSGVSAVKGSVVAFLQAGDTGLASTICRIPKKSLDPEELAWYIHSSVEAMFKPLPPHTFDGDPSYYAVMTAGLSMAGVDANIIVEPSISLIPWSSLLKYNVEEWSSLLLSILYSDGFKAELELAYASREFSSIAAGIREVLARSDPNTAPLVFDRFLSIHNTVSDGAPLSVEKLVIAGACTAILTGSDASSVEAVVEEVLTRQPLAVGRDDRTLILHGIFLG